MGEPQTPGTGPGATQSVRLREALVARIGAHIVARPPEGVTESARISRLHSAKRTRLGATLLAAGLRGRSSRG